MKSFPKISVENVEWKRNGLGRMEVHGYDAIFAGVVKMNKAEAREHFYKTGDYANLSTQADLVAYATAIEMERAELDERGEQDEREEARDYRHGRSIYGRAGFGYLESSMHAPGTG